MVPTGGRLITVCDFFDGDNIGSFHKKGDIQGIMMKVAYRDLVDLKINWFFGKCLFAKHYLFMHDNDSNYVSKIVKNYLKVLESNKILELPQSVNLNPIGLLWKVREQQSFLLNPLNA